MLNEEKPEERTVEGQLDSSPTLDELIARITPENIHPEMDWGPDVGKERWWDED